MGGDNVQVCVRVRPQNEVELEARCRVVAHQTPGEPQLVLGRDKQFTYDYLYDMASRQADIFDGCVRDLVDGALEGKNATVLAYGQTGSGKTFTMGTGFDVDLPQELEGVVPRAVKYLFSQMDEAKASASAKGLPLPEFTVNVSFLELYRTSFFDLFDSTPGRSAANVKILDEKKEDGTTVTTVSNVIQLEVQSVEELMGHLRRGSLGRVTASTDMNARSSRSHAVFTLWVKHRRVASYASTSSTNDMDTEADAADSADEPTTPTTQPAPSGADIVMTTAKFNFVDLAGSERLKRTHATGDRAKEGIDINSGLLALGNVISALGDPNKRGAHVPYRDSKLTRLLQDSLGGNSQTLMIACVAPSDRDFLETLNTLKYANRARNIKNKVVVNQDSASAQIQKMHETIQKLQLELMQFKQGRRPDDSEGGNDLFYEAEYLRKEVDSMKRKIEHYKMENYNLKEQVVAAQLQQVSPAGVTSATGGEGSSEGQEGEGDDGKKAATTMTTIEDILRENVRLKSELAAASKTQAAPAAQRRPSTSATMYADSRPSTSAVVHESMQAIRKGRTVIQKLGALFKNHHKDSTSSSSGAEIKTFDDGSGDDSSSGEEDCDDQDDFDEEEEEAAEDAEKPVPAPEDEDVDAAEDPTPVQGDADGNDDNEDGDDKGGDDNDSDGEADDDGRMARMSETHQQLVEELGLQISIQEKLLAELNDKENELVRQRELYEQKLIEAKREKEQIMQQQMKIKQSISGLQGMSDKETKKIKKEYEKQLKQLQAKMTSMAEESSKQERELAERQKALSQMTTLRNSLKEAKQQRRKLLEEAKAEMKKNKEEQKAKAKEIAKLKKEGTKAAWTHKKIESQLKTKSDALQRTMADNKKLKQELKRVSKEREDAIKLNTKYRKRISGTPSISSSGSVGSSTSSVASHSITGGGGERKPDSKRRRSSAVAKKTKSMLEGEIARVVLYNTIKTDMEALVAKRDLDLIKERLKFEAELKNNNPEPEKVKELKEELDRVDAETELITETIMEKQEELLAMESSGMRASVERDGLSESGQELIENTTSGEARLMLREFFVSLVNKDAAICKQRLRNKELEAELKRKDALLKSFLQSGVSKTDSMKQPERSRGLLRGLRPTRTKKKSTDKEGAGLASQEAYVDPRNFEVSLRRGRSERHLSRPKSRVETKAADELVTERRNTDVSSVLSLSHTIKGHDDEVFAVSCYDNSLATGSKDTTVRLWDLGAQTFEARLTGHQYPVKALLHLGDIILSASRERLRVWDPRATSKCVKKINMKSEIQGLAASEDGQLLYVGSKHVIRIWDIRNYKQVKTISLKSKLKCICATAEGVSTGAIDNCIRMYNLSEKSPAAQTMTPPHYDNVQCVASVGNSVISGSRDYSIKLWSPVKESPGVWHLANSITAAHGHYVSAVGSMPSDKYFVSGDTKGIVKVWDANKCVALSEQSQHMGTINAFTRGHNNVYSASSDRTVKIWRFSDVGLDSAAPDAAVSAEEAAEAPPSLRREGTFTLLTPPEGDNPPGTDKPATQTSGETPTATVEGVTRQEQAV